MMESFVRGFGGLFRGPSGNSEFQAPEIHVWLDQLDAVLPSFHAFIPFPDDYGRVGAVVGAIKNFELLLNGEFPGDDGEAAIGADNARVSFQLLLVALGLPGKADGHPRIHADASALTLESRFPCNVA